MTTAQATVHHLTPTPCSRNCRFGGRTKRHHDRLLMIDRDPAEIIDLMELAVTWGELDYSDRAVIPPSRWLEFGEAHRWTDADQAERVLSLAVDVAMGSMRVNRADHLMPAAVAR